MPGSEPHNDTGANTGKEVLQNDKVEKDEETIQNYNHGKGKETDTPGEQDGSFINRLRASTKMAANAATTGTTLPNILPAGKETGVSNISQSLERLGESSRNSRTISQRAEGAGASIRMVPDPQRSANAFDDFVNNSRSPMMEEANNLQQPSRWQGAGMPAAEHEAADGSAVLDLLSRPDEEPDWAAQASLDDVELSPAAAEKLREALFNSADTKAIAWNDLLNFTPGYLVQSDRGPQTSHEADLHMGTSDMNVANKLWLQQWGDVLSAYSDEVWGDLGPLAAKAREEVASAERDGDGQGGTKALERLKQVLAHVRGY